MTRGFLAFFVAAVAVLMAVQDAEARRIGAGRSIGIQRSLPKTPPAQPAQAAPKQPGAAPAAAATPGRWGAIFGGLALGGLLGYLFGANGVGGMLLIALVAVAGVLFLRRIAAKRIEPRASQVRFAGVPEGMQRTAVRADERPSVGGAAAVPSGFDVSSFLRSAKLNFIKLQAANDLGKIAEIRELTTDEMFDELRREVFGLAGAAQHTDIVALNADLLELGTEGDEHWASIHFSGMVREKPGTAAEEFQEVWNLVKPADGSSGWLLAGIQQMH